MNLRINIIGGPDQGRSFSLTEGQKLTIGRGEQSDTQINDPSVSRVHFEIFHDGASILVADRGSSSGTMVNGAKVENIEVAPGTTIQAGDSYLRIEEADAGNKTVGPAAAKATEPHSIEAKPLPQLIGEVFGVYTLESVIGRSKSGMVFKGRNAEIDRVAAIKVLTPAFTADDEQRQRFVRAMKTMLPIEGDRIIKLYNAGKRGPYCWAAMEFIDGENLAQEIERIGIEGMLDWKKVWRVCLDVGRALKAGYEHKIVHRNVTPTNIIRRRSDGACLLGDFMLAKALDGTLAQQVTQPGQILGDIPYLAPERTRGEGDIDTRSDLYGLGATCYALLTGRPPTGGDSLVEMIKNVRDQQPELPKKFQLSINENFQDSVMKLIAKDPIDRFQTPDELLKELMRIGKFNNLDPGN